MSVRPVQAHPPALWFTCPDCDWTWHADQAAGYEARLEHAWTQHRRMGHDQLRLIEG